MPRAPSTQPGCCLVTLRIFGVGLGSTLVEGWSSRTIDAGSSAAVVGVEVANLLDRFHLDIRRNRTRISRSICSLRINGGGEGRVSARFSSKLNSE